MKLKTLNEIVVILEKFRKNSKKIVFTNGCFDIIHSGHIQYLTEAKALGDILIIGLNSDCSIKKLKGPDRPIIDENNRALVLSALEIVDFVVIFDEETPYNLIKKIKPDILVKGGDWKISEIVGSDVVLNNGGEVRSLNFREGISTTRIIEKIRESKF